MELTQFQSLSNYNKYSERQKLATVLKYCLRGPAAQLIWENGDSADWNFDETVERLVQRFGFKHVTEKFVQDVVKFVAFIETTQSKLVKYRHRFTAG